MDNATVFVYSARLKTGFALVCPTCWLDCGKHASTNSQGHFAIDGLNPDLKFRLLVVKNGFKAATVRGVDPAQEAFPPITLHARAATDNPSQIVKGRVLDAGGSPVPGALVEPEALKFGPGGMYSGSPPDWVDPLAATNAQGEFEIVSGQPFTEITLRISPRGLAAKLVTEPAGATPQVTLTEGATVVGRLVQSDGKSVAGAEVALFSFSNTMGESFDEMRVGTAKDGSFAFSNVPAGRVWGLYPKTDSLAARNLAARPQWCETNADGKVVNFGKLTLRPGFVVRGKVELSDKKDIPPGMHVTLVAEWDINNRLTKIAPDGSFEFKGLAAGVYRLIPDVRGYALSGDAIGELLVERDRQNVAMRMAPRRETTLSSGL
ncbi:MAG TPA: hypothetical protein VGD63_13840 [Steroidobacteraceae bacterium]